MYTQNDLQSLGRQLNKRVLLWLIPELLVLAALVYSYVLRLEWLSSLLLALLAILLLFSLSMSILPVRRYQRFLNNALHGRTRTDRVRFDSVDDKAVTREGVRFYPVLMRADTIKEELDERQYYWDANLPLPDWRQGEALALTSHEKMITAWRQADDRA